MEIEKKVRELIEPSMNEKNFILSDVVIEMEDSNKFLRIIIDKEGTINIDDCVEVTKMINPILDEANLIEGFYILDVCSNIEGSEEDGH